VNLTEEDAVRLARKTAGSVDATKTEIAKFFHLPLP